MNSILLDERGSIVSRSLLKREDGYLDTCTPTVGTSTAFEFTVHPTEKRWHRGSVCAHALAVRERSLRAVNMISTRRLSSDVRETD